MCSRHTARSDRPAPVASPLHSSGRTQRSASETCACWRLAARRCAVLLGDFNEEMDRAPTRSAPPAQLACSGAPSSSMRSIARASSSGLVATPAEVLHSAVAAHTALLSVTITDPSPRQVIRTHLEMKLVAIPEARELQDAVCVEFENHNLWADMKASIPRPGSAMSPGAGRCRRS